MNPTASDSQCTNIKTSIVCSRERSAAHVLAALVKVFLYREARWNSSTDWRVEAGRALWLSVCQGQVSAHAGSLHSARHSSSDSFSSRDGNLSTGSFQLSSKLSELKHSTHGASKKKFCAASTQKCKLMESVFKGQKRKGGQYSLFKKCEMKVLSCLLRDLDLWKFELLEK